jgi:F0F1-type ATP synthase membrane subunit b/b'
MDYRNSPHIVEIFDFDILHMELNTALYILVLVLVVMFFLNKLLFQPVLRTLDNRARLVDSLREARAEHRTEIGRLGEQYQSALTRVRAEVAQVRGERNREAQQTVAAILGQARGQAQSDLEQALADLRQQSEVVRAELSKAKDSLAEQITNRMIQP